jgi:hypothetical protein
MIMTAKRRTALEQYFFRGTPIPEVNTDLCTVSTMPIPERIVKNPIMKQLWDFVCTDMESRRCLSVTYSLLISELCEVIHLMHRCREALDKDGLIVDKFDEEGNYMSSAPNPHYNIMQRQQPMLIKILEKIGMSPRDIHYLVSPEASMSTTAIDAKVTDMKAITYFR